MAIKELQIEKNLNNIQQQWETMRFQIQKHFRGFIISDVDDILQALEDSTLLLNGIFHFGNVSTRHVFFCLAFVTNFTG
jgi:hypothetical protein